MSLTDVKAKLSQFARQGCKVVFVDYIQRVVTGGRDPKHVQVAQVAKTLADLADRLNIAVVVASQLNREGGKNESGPELHHLAESTVIEESADVIILLRYRKAEDESQGRNRPICVNVAKNRHGFGGPFNMFFCGRQFKFSDTPFPVPQPLHIVTPHAVPPKPLVLNIPPPPVVNERKTTEAAAAIIDK
jgi:replicative DNA helicase